MPGAVIAIVGRTNVGKSTLFNRLVGQRRALVRDEHGVTRDRLYGIVQHERWQATLVDTGGLDTSAADVIAGGVSRQALAAVAACDLALLVVDARAGVTPADTEIARLLRRGGRRILLVVNKTDSAGQEAGLGEFHRLGLGEPLAVSAEHGRGIGALLDAARGALGDAQPGADAPRGPAGPRVSIVGRPNVGKSSLVNAMVGAERVLVAPEPGTTRDAVDTAVVRGTQRLTLIDTAGIRRKGRVGEGLERLAVVMALKYLERSDVALVVLDASEGLTAQDAHIAGYAAEAGRACVLVVNKWDLVPPGVVRRAEVVDQVRDGLAFLDYAPICFVSAVAGTGLDELFAGIALVDQEAARRVPAPDVAAAVRAALARRPVSAGGRPLTLQSAVQVGVRPPTFLLRVNQPALVHFSYRRYLVNALRDQFGFAGSPIRVALKRAVGPRAGARHPRGR